MRPHSGRRLALPPSHRLFTDGGARGNPGPAGIGVVLVSPGGDVVEEIGRGIGKATNNVAEYEALIEGLKLALKHSVTRLEVLMDSLLVVQQMRGAFKVKNPGLQPLHRAARDLAGQFDWISFKAIPRAENSHADRLANHGMDEGAAARRAPASSGEPGLGGRQKGLF
jgi:ribonuclease HI